MTGAWQEGRGQWRGGQWGKEPFWPHMMRGKPKAGQLHPPLPRHGLGPGAVVLHEMGTVLQRRMNTNFLQHILLAFVVIHQ